MASIYLPPIARKKKVEGWPRQDTFRVFSDFQANSKQETTSYGSHFVRHNIPPTPQRPVSPNRKNKPQPTAVTFLRQNPRFVCEPICHVDTASKEETLHSWWPDETVQRPVTKPQYSFNSTSRADYQNFSICSPRTSYSRHEVLNRSPSKTQASVGIVPGCTLSQELPHVTEKISYEHQFNSRLDPSHPVRGKRHGCFVWKVSTPVWKTELGRHQNTNALRDRKEVFYELKNNDTEDNSDAKSVVSTITEKPKSQEPSDSDKNNDSEIHEPQVKNNAWNSPETANDQQSKVAKQPQQMIPDDNVFDLTDREEEDMIKPSRPRRQSSPPHLA